MIIGGRLAFLFRPFHVMGVCEGKKQISAFWTVGFSFSFSYTLGEGVQPGSIYKLARVPSAIISSDEVYFYFS